MSARRTIGRFLLDAEIAAGGSGKVFRGRDAESGAEVAVKVVPAFLASDAARFAREVEVLRRLDHPGVVRYVDHGTTPDGDAYLAMEWLEGEDLRARLARAGLGINEALILGRRVAEALAAVHARGVVHRDVKPGNIFLPGCRVEDTKLIDFGLARADDGEAAVTYTGLVVGTPAYMAPEQARGQREVDGRADIFALGCVLHKCLVGRAPFEGSSVMAVLARILLDEAPRLSALRPEIPGALDDLVGRMLDKNPERRPQRADEVAAALAAVGTIAEGEDAEPAPPSRVLRGLTAEERRVMSMLLVGRLAAGDAARAWIASLAVEHGAHIDPLAGGRRVVTFTGGAAATDQAARAARFALALHARIPSVTIALATGRGEVAGRVPVGDAIERAARMLAARAEAAIAVDEVSAALLGARFDVRDDGAGLRLYGAREAASSARTLLGRPVPMIGREWELSSVEAIFRECVEEPLARPLLVTGAAGMGKSRLAHEVVRVLRESHPDLVVWSASGDPLRAGSALALVGEVVRGAAGVREGEPLAARQKKLSARVAAHVPPADAVRVAAFLGELVDTPAAAETPAPVTMGPRAAPNPAPPLAAPVTMGPRAAPNPAPPLAAPVTMGPRAAPNPAPPLAALRAARQDPRIMGEQIRAAFEALLAAETAAHPVLLVLDDLHWADAPSLRVIEAALRALDRRPWMVLALGRPELADAFPNLWQRCHAQEIRLKPLARRASERLVREVLGDAIAPAEAARLAAHADGNAFYLEELMRAVAEAPRGGPLPETVLAMVHARLAALDPDARRALRAASVFGDVFWPGGVAALLGAPPPGDWVERLVARELVVPRADSRFAGERELAFRHALLREGAYAALTEADRALGHRLAGAWLEAHGERDTLVLAQHFERAGDARRAASYQLAAAAQALRGADHAAAVERAEKALPACEGEARVECLTLLAGAHVARTEWERASARAGEAAGAAKPGSVAWARALAARQSAGFSLGRPQEILESIALLALVDPAPEAASAVAEGLAIGVMLAYLGGRTEAGVAILGRVEALASKRGASGRTLADEDVLLRAWRDFARGFHRAWSEGDPWAAHASARAAEASFLEAGDTRHAQFTAVFVGATATSLGLLDEAQRILGPLVAASDDTLVAVLGAVCLLEVLADRGALAEVRDLAEKRIERALAEGGPLGGLHAAQGRWYLGEAAARSGDLATAERELAASLPGLAAVPAHRHLAAARLALVKVARGDAAGALALAREARDALAAQGGSGPRGTLIRLAHVVALDATGDRDGARRAFAEAQRELSARAARIPDEAVRRAFLERVPEHAELAARARRRA